MSDIKEIFGIPVRIIDLPEGLELVLHSEDGKQAVVLTSDGKVNGPLWRQPDGSFAKEKAPSGEPEA